MHHRVLTGAAAAALGLLAFAVPAAVAETAQAAPPPPAAGASPGPSASLVPLGAPGAPWAYDVTATSATVAWAPAGGPAFRYLVYRLVDGAWQQFAVTPGATGYQLTGLTPGTTYTLAVVAYALANSGYATSPMSPPGSFTTLPAGGTPAPTGLSCQATFTLYPGGFTGSVTVRDGGTASVTGWTVTFTRPANMTLYAVWNAVLTTSGSAVSLANLSWNGAIPPGGTVSVGFAGGYTGTFVPPSDIRASGVPCTVLVN